MSWFNQESYTKLTPRWELSELWWNSYMLLEVLLYQQKHSGLINYLDLLLLDEIPVISSSTEELRYEERYFKNFMSFKTKRKLITKFLFYFLRKENVKSFITLYTNVQVRTVTFWIFKPSWRKRQHQFVDRKFMVWTVELIKRNLFCRKLGNIPLQL